ncbi:MAG: Fe-S cluster assembly protein SufB, partial [Acholeplasmataceae bacterium]|nr:Fe-S cluster assembly protein SufB [Acholeplasmataceae bacterium]
MDDNKKKIDKIIGEYEYGFKTDIDALVDTGKGLSEAVVRRISELKNEPKWMLEYRLKSYHEFIKRPQPSFGPNLDGIEFDEITYFARLVDEPKYSWDEVPEEIKETFERLGIPEAERKFLAGVSTQFESEV